MLGLLALERDRLLQFLGWIALVALFHRTVLVMLVLPASTLSGLLHFSQLIRLGLLTGAGFGLYSRADSKSVPRGLARSASVS